MSELIQFEVTLGLDVTLNRTIKVRAKDRETAEKKARRRAEKELTKKPFHKWDFDARMGVSDTEILNIEECG